jgi:hypothetical protein
MLVLGTLVPASRPPLSGKGDDMDPDLTMPSYSPNYPNWEYLSPCIDGENRGSGDRPLEKRHLEPEGLYYDNEVGEGPDSWGI